MKIKKKPILISALSLVLCMAMVFGFMYRSPLVAFAVSSPQDNRYVFENGDKIQVVSWYGNNADVFGQLDKFENPDKPDTYLWWDETTLTYNERTDRWKADSPMRWQNMDKDGNTDLDHCFFAYYPATLASPDDDLTKIPITLTGDSKKDDYLSALFFGKRPDNNVVSLRFNHLMAKLDINLTFGNQYRNVTDVVVKTELVNTGELDLLAPQVHPYYGSTAWQTLEPELKGHYDWNGTTIALPQTVNNMKVIISFKADGQQKELTYTHPRLMHLDDNRRTTLNLTVGKDVVEFVEVNVADWADGGTINAGEAEECMHTTYDANNLCTVCGKKKEDGQ